MFLAKLVACVEQYRFDLVVMDTLSKLWPVRDENDASQVDEALMPLWAIKNANACVLLVHHTRKSGGGEFTAARGSSGLTAFTDLLMELRRSSDTRGDPRRIIKATGRYRDIPDEILVELTTSGYVSLGDPDDSNVRLVAKTFEWERDLDAVMVGIGDRWWTFDAIHEAVADRRNGARPRNNDFVQYMRQKYQAGEYERQGNGKKGRPYEYRLAQ